MAEQSLERQSLAKQGALGAAGGLSRRATRGPSVIVSGAAPQAQCHVRGGMRMHGAGAIL
jgi:hypothetical protein